MRQETDFVLEQAAWPALLLEEGGTIRRANRAARQVFGDVLQGRAVPLANLWADNDSAAAQKFLGEEAPKGTCEVELRVNTGKKADFIAHVTRVGRDGQTYLVLQLFKESGGQFPELNLVPLMPAAPKPTPAKEEKPFQLLNAAWPTLVVERNGNVIRANQAALKTFGPNLEKDGASLGAIWSPDNKSTAEKFLSQSTEDTQIFKLRSVDGAMVPYQAQCCPIAETKGVLVQFTKDVKPPAPAVAPEPAKTKSAEEFLLDNADWPAMLVQKTGKIVQANRAAVRAFGPSIERDEPQLGAIWSQENKESANQFLNLPAREEPVPLKFRLKSGMPGLYLVQLCVTPDDDVCLVQLLKELNPDETPATPSRPEQPAAAPPHPLQEAGPLPPGATAFSSAVESGLAHKQKLDCALQLARSVSLDFNNALTSILGHTSLLLSKAEANNPWRNSLVEIEKSASRAAEIANDLAAFSRQEKDVRVQHSGNVNTLLERCIEAFRGPEYKDITWTLQLERKLFTANFDEAKMQQAMVKILENAVQVLKNFGKISVQTRNLELSVATQDRTAKLNPGNYICIEISDSGEGIPAEVLPRIFEPFFTTKGSRHRGLGLAFVYGIVTNHGGGVAVSSQPGIGTSVRVYLPANAKIVRDTSAGTDNLSGKETILIVDDEDLLLTMGQMVLSSFGYTVLTANSGQKALELFSAAKKPIDLVITDLVMPNMSGRELTEHIIKIAPHTRIIWSSGYVRSANAVEEENYLQKPFTSQDLLRKVKQVLSAAE